MKRGCLTALVVLGVIIGGIVLWYKSSFPTYTYRYRIIVNVDTPDGVRSASSVIEVRIQTQPKVGDVGAYYHHVRGEAVFVDLGNGKNIIALLAGGPNGSYVDYPQYVVPGHFGGGYSDEILRGYVNLTGGWALPLNEPKRLPTFVTFTDLNDPLSARVVPPNQFESVFGPGTRLRDVTIEMTKDDVTRRIEGKIGWIGKYDLETSFERRLRETGSGGGGSLTPGLNLRRNN